MEKKAELAPKIPNFILLSGHDGTILTLFAALGITDAGA